MPLPRFENLEPPRRAAILAAAADEFGERGFDGASYNRIIERAGISKGAMYYYFADKDDLFRTVLESALGVWFQQVGVPFQADDAASFWSAAEAMYERSLLFMLEDRRNAAMCLAVTRARERREGHPALLELDARMHAWVAALIEHGRRVGAVRDDVPPDLMAHVALSMLEAGDRWLATQWKDMDAAKARATAATMVGMLRRVAALGRKRNR
jgi:AcrR family transcriptional regulator